MQVKKSMAMEIAAMTGIDLPGYLGTLGQADKDTKSFKGAKHIDTV